MFPVAFDGVLNGAGDLLFPFLEEGQLILHDGLFVCHHQNIRSLVRHLCCHWSKLDRKRRINSGWPARGVKMGVFDRIMTLKSSAKIITKRVEMGILKPREPLIFRTFANLINLLLTTLFQTKKYE